MIVVKRSRIDKDWFINQLILDDEEPISEYNKERLYEIQSRLNFDEILSIMNTYIKCQSNVDSLKALRSRVGDYCPKPKTRSRPHHPLRKRGYDDKGSLPDQDLKIIRRINSEDAIHIIAIGDNLPSLLRLLEQHQHRILSNWGDYVLLSRLEELVSELEDQGLITSRALWELDELIDFVYSKKNNQITVKDFLSRAG